jgi:selenocysteine lyase/cysteine desulfurase
MTGTQNHEGLAGTLAAIEHLAWIGSRTSEEGFSRREALRAAFEAIESYEKDLCWRMIEGLLCIEGVKILGITDNNRRDERAPTVSFTHPRKTASEIADALAKQGIFVWAGNFYALELTEELDLEPEGVLRVGVLHYNTMEEVERFLSAVRGILE